MLILRKNSPTLVRAEKQLRLAPNQEQGASLKKVKFCDNTDSQQKDTNSIFQQESINEDKEDKVVEELLNLIREGQEKLRKEQEKLREEQEKLREEQKKLRKEQAEKEFWKKAAQKEQAEKEFLKDEIQKQKDRAQREEDEKFKISEKLQDTHSRFEDL